MRSAPAFATPVAMVPTPACETSFTETSACPDSPASGRRSAARGLDRVDVVVRRRRDQADAGRARNAAGDQRIDLVAGQLAAFAGLAPCAILICSTSALTRYSGVTPKRPEAICLIFADLVAAVARRDPRRPRRNCCARRGGSSRSPALRAPPATTRPATSPRYRSGARWLRWLDLVERNRRSPSRRRARAGRATPPAAACSPHRHSAPSPRGSPLATAAGACTTSGLNWWYSPSG